MVTMSKDNSNNNALSVNKPKFMKSSKGQRYQRSFFSLYIKKELIDYMWIAAFIFAINFLRMQP